MNFLMLGAKQVGRLGLRSRLQVYRECVLASSVKPNSSLLTSVVYNPSKSHVRCWSFIPGLGKSSKYLETRFRMKVGIPDDYELIYKPPLTKEINAAEGIGAFTVIGLSASFGYQYFTEGGLKNFRGNSIVADSFELVGFTAIFLVLNLCVAWIGSTYIIKIYQKGKSYIAVLPRGIPALHSKVTFSRGDVVQIRPKGFWPWRYNMFKIKGKSYMLYSHHFRKPSDFNTMLGIVKQ